MDALSKANLGIAQYTQAGPPAGTRFATAEKPAVNQDQVELSPNAKKMQNLNRRMTELINGDTSEEYRPLKMQDVLQAIRGH